MHDVPVHGPELPAAPCVTTSLCHHFRQARGGSLLHPMLHRADCAARFLSLLAAASAPCSRHMMHTCCGCRQAVLLAAGGWIRWKARWGTTRGGCSSWSGAKANKERGGVGCQRHQSGCVLETRATQPFLHSLGGCISATHRTCNWWSCVRFIRSWVLACRRRKLPMKLPI